jgi:hydroxyacylglutathione hydrolase
MILEHFLLSVNETNCFVIGCLDTREAVIIDPGEWNRQIADFLKEQQLTLTWILLTHGHVDHTGGIEAIRRTQQVQIAAHRLYPSADRTLAEGDTLTVGQYTIKVLELPGHTPDSLAFVLGSDIFSGDALFAGSVGGTSTPQNYLQLTRNIRDKIFSLGDDMLIHPGHGPDTTVQIERLFNPFFMV